MKLSDKILLILKEKKISKGDLADLLGVGSSSVYKIVRGETKKISHKNAIKIEELFPEYSYSWLTSENTSDEKDIKVNQEDFSKLVLSKNGVAFNMEEIAFHVATNEEDYMNMKVFSNVIEKRVVERILEIVKDGGLKEYLN